MNNFQQQPQETINTQVGLNAFLTRMFGWMGASVLVSALTAYLMVANQVQLGNGGMLVALIVWFILPFVITGQSLKRPTTAIVGLMVYAVLTGAVVSMYAYVYTGQAIGGAFVSSAAVFLTMATIGLTTKKDLSRIGTQATAALIGLLVAMVINLFLKSSGLALIFSFIAVIIFSALTAWDTQKMQKLYLHYGDQVSMTGLAINGALQLYLDFVNLFLQLLQIFGMFGGSRD
ncbi:Bax inhibitor-1/YccA family protein [Levilactobacillus suantsaii]|uniref:Bax inhibitor-1/YccA family protein n=1 Tax=Levilactobacillus suantsaii TaxID=2292255 RepID=A0A4Q0VKL1_9LACO|nr:Bax inhibitor-1/YccA family protein [Levilactobacillus suantsaii]QMU07834.1 Bax inhibitor-1/YccA family protein [Levilactobacillus suantsaii]RXI79464.1 Bax inhibitor-1/YccA family protein [Levilactobacillus suantsaii]